MLKYLLEKEFRLILRNPFMPRIIVLFPVMMMLLMPLAANFEVRDINLAVVDGDKSPRSRELVDKVVCSGYFHLSLDTTRYGAARAAVERDDADVILEIPAGFERDLVAATKTAVMISANGVNQVKAGLGSSYLAGIVQAYARDVRVKKLTPLPAPLVPWFDVVPRFLFNPFLRYSAFMVPALTVTLLAMLCGFLPALNIVGEKERGTMEQMNVTPVTRLQFIMAKLIPHWVIGFITLTIALIITRLVYGLAPRGSVGTIYGYAAVFMLGMTGFGLVISNYAKTLQQAMFMMFFFVITWIYLSGLYTPVAGMPPWARVISIASPLRYVIAVLRAVYLRGSGFFDLWRELLALLAFAVILNAWAILSYRKTT